ncbi:peptide deformylase [Candidatus Haliotispira prima]|uniref:Peptide deformylase n=1 Tax=Candidatus Haliotispira prima TaxID=3034016 RepID=A0ABY8MLV3_9SPIO|nr:peptide deformylase [Candidatus Haliotispira prima]
MNHADHADHAEPAKPEDPNQTRQPNKATPEHRPIFTEVQTAREWLEIIPQMRLLTIESEQDETDLHRRSAEVTMFGKELAQFCLILLEHMREEQGIGLAAPQMGVFQRIFVSQVNEGQEPLIVINPLIQPAEESKETGEEGCLSVPGILADVERWPAIDITAQNPYGKTFKLHLEGMDSICFQHENDHLEGTLFIDYLTRSQVKKVRKHFAEQRATKTELET